MELTYANDIITTLREPFLVLDKELRVKTANQSFCKTFHVTREETEGKFIYELGNGQWDIPRLRELLKQLPENEVIEGFPVEHDFPSIGPRYMLLNARRLPPGENWENILLAIEDQSGKDHPIFMMDLDGKIISWNAEAERVIGYTEKEIIGKHFSILFTAEDLKSGLCEEKLWAAKIEGRAVDERWRVRKDGTCFWALGIVTPMMRNNNVIGYSKILRDMTERKQAEQLLQEEGVSLRETDRRKNEFLAMLAHELRNPLAPITNAISMLRRMATTEGQMVYVTMIERQVGILTRLVEDLLEVSRITTGQIKIKPQRMDMRVLIEGATTGILHLVEKSNLTLEINLSQNPIWVMGDPSRMEQVVVNLLHNAIKYTQTGGHIRLSLEADKNTAVMYLRVKDTGIGINRADLAHVFDLFYQSDKSLDRARGGLGIGLSLVRRLVELHGGTVSAYSEGQGKGSEFVIRLPVLNGRPDEDAVHPKDS